MTALLLLVDLQRDYLASPDLEPDAESVVRAAMTLLRGCRELGVPVAHVWTTVSRRDDRRMRHWKREDRWLCEEGTPGHAPPAGLEPRRDEPVAHKTAYSAFTAGELERIVRAPERELVVIAGVHLHACVRQAVIDIYGRGDDIEIWVAEDATASDDPVHAAISRRYLEDRAARFMTVAEALAALRLRSAPSARAATEPRVGAATVRCRAALGRWQAVGAAKRADVLVRLADLLEPRAEQLAEAMARAIGKPVRYGTTEVTRTATMLRAVAARAISAGEETVAGAELRRSPLGVVAVVTPWNNPVYIPLGKIAAALVYGNAVAWKPAPAAQPIAELLVPLLAAAGAPDGLVVAVAGGAREAATLMADAAVGAVALTGSSLAGFAAQEICARRRVPLQAELGGNNAAIVWPDADLRDAARQIAEGAFALAGQRCTANRRVIVHRDCRDELLELLSRETAALPTGDPRLPATKIGPLLDAAARDRVADLIARAAADVGPIVVPHGETPAADGYAFYPATIVRCEEPAHRLVQRETFGPVLVVQTASDWDDAIALLNGVSQGLAAALFSRSADLAERFTREAAAGILKLNRSTADADVDVPFGGWKASGIGPPEHGSFDRDFYTRPQVVYR